ncbi:MAG: hypothetical protein WBP79_14990 [Candidatus Acidiferrales bacterium]
MKCTVILLCLAMLVCSAGLPAIAETQQTDPPPQAGPDQVPSGTRLLIALQDVLSTKDDKAGKSFRAVTLEPLTTPDGARLPAGVEIRGHIDKIEPPKQAGRARIWLTFDDIETRNGRMPIVAQLIDAPGVHSIRVVYDHEGEIETSTSKRQREAEAAVAGAIAGAAAGASARNGKDAAIGAALGAATAFLVTSGLGQDLTIEKNTKLEIVFERPLSLGRS